jgi:hypothetical protein
MYPNGAKITDPPRNLLVVEKYSEERRASRPLETGPNLTMVMDKARRMDVVVPVDEEVDMPMKWLWMMDGLELRVEEVVGDEVMDLPGLQRQLQHQQQRRRMVIQTGNTSSRACLKVHCDAVR